MFFWLLDSKVIIDNSIILERQEKKNLEGFSYEEIINVWKNKCVRFD